MSRGDQYCGVGKVPKGKRRGNMKECAETGQIRRYGEVKIDSKTLAAAKSKDVVKETRGELIIQHTSAKGTINSLTKYITTIENKVSRGVASEIDKQKLKESKATLKKANTMLAKTTEKLKKILIKEEIAKKSAAATKTKAALKITGSEAAKKIPLSERKKILKKGVGTGTKRKTAADFEKQQERLKPKPVKTKTKTKIAKPRDPMRSKSLNLF